MSENVSDDEYGNRHKIATVAEVEEDGSFVIEEIRGREIALYNIDGEFYALANFCPHQAGPLCEGEVTGVYEVGEDGWEWKYNEDQKVIRCPWHNWGFDMDSGDNIKDDRYKVPTYDTEIDGEDIYVHL